MFKKILLTLLIIEAISTSFVFAQDQTLKGTLTWDEPKARHEALKNIERQIDTQYFKSKDEQYFEHVKSREQNPNLKFQNSQITYFSGGEYSVVTEGEKNVHYYTKDGTLFKVSVCDVAFSDNWNYPRRCIEYGYPRGNFLTVSMDVSPEESYVFSPDGTLLYHWKDEQGFDAKDNTVWERWNDRETIEKGSP